MTPCGAVDPTTENAIGLCMIVKNEAEYLEGCLKHIAPYAAELIIVDTGSSDGSPAIARRCGACVHSFPWTNDFSAARNFSLQQASTPWILVLDADERLAARDAARLAHLVQSAPEASAFSLLQRNYLNGSGQLTWDRSWQPNTFEYEESNGYAGYIDIAVARLFRRIPQIRFAGCVHESIEGALAASGLALEPSGLVLHHYGQVRDSARVQQKMGLYLELGMKKLKEEPSAARAHFELGIQYQSLKSYADAIPHFLVALEQDASFAIADLYAGICYSRLDQYQQASWHLERARRSLPSSPELECELGLIDLKQGKFERAGTWFERALKRHPKHVASLSYLGAVKTRLGRLDEGIVFLETALVLDPGHCDSWVNLGAACRQARQNQRSCQCYEKALELAPDDPQILRSLALAVSSAGRLAESIVLLRKAAALWPSDEVLQTYWAAALAATGDEEGALKVYQSIVDKGGKLSQLARRQTEAIGRRKLAPQFASERTQTAITTNQGEEDAT